MPEICDWIDSRGGPNGLTESDVYVILDSFLFNIPPSGYSFIPTESNVYGVLDYFLGMNGDALTGCSYFTADVSVTNVMVYKS